MQEETQIGREKEQLRWKQTLTFNVLYWSEGREGGRRGRVSSRQWRETVGGLSDGGGKWTAREREGEGRGKDGRH